MDSTNALNAHASQAFGVDAYPPTEPGSSFPPSPGAPPSPGVHPVPDAPPAPVAPTTEPPAAPAPPPPPPATAATHSLVATTAEQCPSCGTPVAPDQRYCLTCGARCGEPRLPIMDAVTFMDAMKQPRGGASTPPPQRPQRRVSPNMALFATIGVLLLAMGVGVLIGRSGNHSVASAPAAPQVIEVGHTGGSGTAANEGASGGGAGTIGGNSKKEKPKKLKAEAESGQGAKEVLHYVPGVKPPPPTIQKGEKCEEGVAGCKNGEFGTFFE
jgi:hypothetical protein